MATYIDDLPQTELNDVVTRKDLRSFMRMIKQNFLLRKEIPDFDLETYLDPVTKKFRPEVMPSCMDDVIEGQTIADFPEEGASGTIYICLEDSEIYRWSGSQYIKISDSSKSAAKLTNPCMINGVEFDGTKDVIIHLTEDDNLTTENMDKLFDAALKETAAVELESGMNTEQAEDICAETIGSFPEPVEIHK